LSKSVEGRDHEAKVFKALTLTVETLLGLNTDQSLAILQLEQLAGVSAPLAKVDQVISIFVPENNITDVFVKI
jgi:hypothetical protein